MAFVKSKYIDLSAAPWTMHEFFAGSGLVGYGLKGMFAPIWANDISERKAVVYTANFGDEHFLLDDIKNINGSEIKLRTSKRAHPQMREISIPLLKKMQDLLPTIFDDIQIEG